MAADLPCIGVIGAGRMGEGIALAFAHAGIPITVIDVKQRSADDRSAYFQQVRAHLDTELQLLARLGVLTADQSGTIAGRIGLASRDEAAALLARCDLLFEAVPEVLAIKAEQLQWVGENVAEDTVIASTTSTFLVTELATMVPRPERFINAHWLNPAHLMPLVEVSRSEVTADATVQKTVGLLKAIGKVPVLCNPVAGYIVPRIQALAMNEAARMVEEGVASAEDIDTAVRIGFGLRFSVLGLLEFIDWGGGDILYYASRYLAGALAPRFEPPDIIAEHMRSGHNGLRERQGFYDYRTVDVDAYKLGRLREFVRKLELAGLVPRLNAALAPPREAQSRR